MKRCLVHLSVQDLEPNIRFYSTLFGQAPSRQEDDYAKWMLEDPRINFAISTRGASSGLDHFGFQMDDDEELEQLRERAREHFVTMGEIRHFGAAPALSDNPGSGTSNTKERTSDHGTGKACCG